MYQSQGGWNSPVTSKLLFEAGVLYNNKDYPTLPQPDNAPNQVAYRDLGTGFSWGNYGNIYGHNASHNFNTRLAASYVTGSHALKSGVTYMHLWAWTSSDVVNNGMTLQLRNGVPTPGDGVRDAAEVLRASQRELGPLRAGPVDAQAADASTPASASTRCATSCRRRRSGRDRRCRPATSRSTQVDNVPNWKDMTPRLGVAYDLFGTGKTARQVQRRQVPGSAEPADLSRVRRIRPARSSRARRAPGPIATAISSRRSSELGRDQPVELRHDQHQHPRTPTMC